MDKQLHLYILDVLQQSNAVDKMVDIKAAFAPELETTQGRKHLKAQLEFLVNEGLIEAGKFDFLGWELLTGLYSLDNKKIEARLTGRWQSFLSKRGTGIKREPVILPPAPEPAPVAKLKLYDAPAAVLPYPGVDVNKAETPPTPVPVNAPAEPVNTDEPEIKPRYLKEDDFLPFKSRKAIQAETLNTEPPKTRLPETADGPQELKPLSTEAYTYTTPKTAEPDAVTDFTDAKSTYTPPRADVGDVAVIVTPFKPTPPEPQQDEDKPARIPVTVRRKNVVEEPEEPIFTSRATLRTKPVAPAAPVEQTPPPIPRPTPAERVISFRPQAEPFLQSGTAEHNYDDVHLPPPTINYAAIRFDTEHNPFNGLGTIDLTGSANTQRDDDDADKAKKPIAKIKKQIISGIILAVILLAVIIYKMRY